MSQRTPTLLYIDDDAALARLVERGLTRAGYKAAAPDTAAEPARAAQRDEPRLAEAVAHARAGQRRERAGQGQPVWYLVPDGVVQYITKNNLYSAQPDKPL